MLIFLFKNTIGVKQVDILGPIFSLFFICAIMITWRAKLDINPCIFRSKNDNKMTGRRYTARGEELFLLYSEYTIQPSYSLTEIILSQEQLVLLNIFIVLGLRFTLVSSNQLFENCVNFHHQCIQAVCCEQIAYLE